MSARTIAYVLLGVSYWAFVWWVVYAFARLTDRLDHGNWLPRSLILAHRIMWWLAGPGFLVNVFMYTAAVVFRMHGPLGMLIDALSAVSAAYACVVWWRARNWPHDRNWKKRLRAAFERVTASRGRLVVVPT